MAASSNRVAKSWPLNSKRRATNGSNPLMKRMRWASMVNMLARGLSRGAVEELSRQKGEPDWMLQKRLQAWDIYESMPIPLGRRGDLGTLRMFSNFKFQQLNPYVPSNANEKLPAPIEHSLQEALVDQRSGLVVDRKSTRL